MLKNTYLIFLIIINNKGDKEVEYKTFLLRLK